MFVTVLKRILHEQHKTCLMNIWAHYTVCGTGRNSAQFAWPGHYTVCEQLSVDLQSHGYPAVADPVHC